MEADTGSYLRALPRIIFYLGFTFLCIPVQAMALLLRRRQFAARFPRYYHRICLRLLGIKVIIVGKRSKAKPTLYVANHSSYLDIPVLGALLPASFVAKAEVAGWPLFGLLAKLQQTIFIDRDPKHAVEHSDDMKGRLLKGHNVILFPEGTSSDGNRTLPFKTSMFSVASLRVKGRNGAEEALTVQPVSITCVALDGMPTGRFMRPLYSWFGDIGLVPHLWTFLTLGQLTVVVQFHAPVDAETLGSRKAVADHCWRTVSDGVSNAVAGYAWRKRRWRLTGQSRKGADVAA
jgi:1-acyl-sn-glycerol-3-phosphate acyltransferase